MSKKWIPLDKKKISEIKLLFKKIYPEKEYGKLSEKISLFWVDMLEKSWKEKPEKLKKLDTEYDPSDPLSRVEQKTTVIAYADSISRRGEPTLETLDKFLKKYFPAVGGIHILPACRVVEDRFNDGYFSQVERDNIHSAFGSNELFADIIHRYFSMNDLVMGHVDIENPVFQDYLAGNDTAGLKFFTLSLNEYEELKSLGSFVRIFRPRPFPLFTIFRRLPSEEPYRSLSHEERTELILKIIKDGSGIIPDERVINILWLFRKILNDQMLLDEDYRIIPQYIEYLNEKGINKDYIFTESATQEVEHIPYIFVSEIDTAEKLLHLSGFSEAEAESVGRIFEQENWKIFGEEIRALTTFSHVQVDVNTTTFEGLKAFCEDLMWYLTKDLNMLRLDAVNYAFKKWGTSCFGLPELDLLMKIVYLSMECISPRMIPNLEVNDSLTTILKTMSSGESAPPMMHDFFLASLLPAVFHSCNPEIIGRIFRKISEYDVPHNSIRFSLSESHDGKSVRGSLDLLTFEERMQLTDAVIKNKGHVKYKSIPLRESSSEDFEKFCRELSIKPDKLKDKIFQKTSSGESALVLKEEIREINDILETSGYVSKDNKAVFVFFFSRLLSGRDPYELCITTRDSLPRLNDPVLEAERFLSFQTLAFAVMGRNVKTIYFNDLLALPNDYERVKKSGELRDIKRTKSDYDAVAAILEKKDSFEYRVAKGINNLIALADSDPALFYRGNEAEYINLEGNVPAAVLINSCGEAVSLTAVNLTAEKTYAVIPAEKLPFKGAGKLFDNISDLDIAVTGSGLKLEVEPFGRLWLSEKPVRIPEERIIR